MIPGPMISRVPKKSLTINQNSVGDILPSLLAIYGSPLPSPSPQNKQTSSRNCNKKEGEKTRRGKCSAPRSWLRWLLLGEGESHRRLLLHRSLRRGILWSTQLTADASRCPCLTSITVSSTSFSGCPRRSLGSPVKGPSLSPVMRRLWSMWFRSYSWVLMKTWRRLCCVPFLLLIAQAQLSSLQDGTRTCLHAATE